MAAARRSRSSRAGRRRAAAPCRPRPSPARAGSAWRSPGVRRRSGGAARPRPSPLRMDNAGGRRAMPRSGRARAGRRRGRATRAPPGRAPGRSRPRPRRACSRRARCRRSSSVADEEVALGEVLVERGERPVSGAPLRLELGRVLLPLGRGPRSRTARPRGWARSRTARRTSTGGRAHARSGSSGTYAVPSARYQRIAFDSARCSPSVELERRHAQRRVLPAEQLAPVRAVDHVDLDALVRRFRAARAAAAPCSSCPRAGSCRAAWEGYRRWARYSSRSERVRTAWGWPSRATTTAWFWPRRSEKTCVDRVVEVDGGERRLHRGGDVLAERVGVAEDAVEQQPLVQRADHVGQRLGGRVAHDRQLRDAVALHQLDRRAELLVRLADDQVGNAVLGVLEREHRARPCPAARAARGSRARASSCRRTASRGSRVRRRGSWSGSSPPGPKRFATSSIA